jgi:LmbE family N-acetylglucosaminyl deacetylase
VTVVSPHFDDVPLSLGQSLRDGVLSRCEVRVQVVFGRTNWCRWLYPLPSRAAVVGRWRRGEESVAARRFGYRWSAGPWPEAFLRWGAPDHERLLDATAELGAEPLVAEVAEWLVGLAASTSPAPELLLVPAGLGGHVDHRIVALAAAASLDRFEVPVGFYEERPYVAHLDPDAIGAQLAPLGLDLEPHNVSAPVTAATQRLVRRCYPSQIDAYFVQAMERDLAAGAVERAWFPVGTAPEWIP